MKRRVRRDSFKNEDEYKEFRERANQAKKRFVVKKKEELEHIKLENERLRNENEKLRNDNLTLEKENSALRTNVLVEYEIDPVKNQIEDMNWNNITSFDDLFDVVTDTANNTESIHISNVTHDEFTKLTLQSSAENSSTTTTTSPLADATDTNADIFSLIENYLDTDTNTTLVKTNQTAISVGPDVTSTSALESCSNTNAPNNDISFSLSIPSSDLSTSPCHDESISIANIDLSPEYGSNAPQEHIDRRNYAPTFETLHAVEAASDSGCHVSSMTPHGTKTIANEVSNNTTSTTKLTSSPLVKIKFKRKTQSAKELKMKDFGVKLKLRKSSDDLKWNITDITV